MASGAYLVNPGYRSVGLGGCNDVPSDDGG
jgi:hypothetical protein